MIVITEREKVGDIEGKLIYKITKTNILQIPPDIDELTEEEVLYIHIHSLVTILLCYSPVPSTIQRLNLNPNLYSYPHSYSIQQ